MSTQLPSLPEKHSYSRWKNRFKRALPTKNRSSLDNEAGGSAVLSEDDSRRLEELSAYVNELFQNDELVFKSDVLKVFFGIPTSPLKIDKTTVSGVEIQDLKLEESEVPEPRQKIAVIEYEIPPGVDISEI